MTKRSSTSKEHDNLPASPSSASPPTKMLSSGLGRREPCTVCSQPVFLAQRLLVERRLYHRTCFRCARCSAQLTLASCYQTETGQYCCETCPDEEEDSPDSQPDSVDMHNLDMAQTINKPLSDEEKTSLNIALNTTIDIKPKVASPAFTGFLNSQCEEDDSDDEDVLPALPTTLPPESHHSIAEEISENPHLGTSVSTTKTDEQSVNNASESSDICVSLKVSSEQEEKFEDCVINSAIVCVADTNSSESLDSKQQQEESSVHIEEEINVNQLETATSLSHIEEGDSSVIENDETIEITKDSKNTPSCLPNTSLVKTRMKMFEAADSEVDRETSKQAVSTKSRHKINDQFNLELSSDIISVKDDRVSSHVDVSESRLSDEINITEESQDVPYESNVPLDASTNLEDIDRNHQIMDEPSLDKNELCTQSIDSEETKDSVPEILIEEDNPQKVEEETTSVKIEDDTNTEVVSHNESKSKIVIYPEHLNPFSDDEDEEDDVNNKSINEESQQSKSDRSISKYDESLNPFEDNNEEEESRPQVAVRKKSGEKPPRPPPPAIVINSSKNSSISEGRKVVAAPSLNPFTSDEDSEEEKTSLRMPVPTPRSKLYDEHSSLSVSQQSFHGSSTSLSSTISRRKKAPAPKPPGMIGVPQPCPRKISLPEVENESMYTSTVSQLSSPSLSLSHISPQVSPRLRKRRPAPPPPMTSSQPSASSTLIESPSSHHSLNVSEQHTNDENTSLSLTQIQIERPDSSLSNSKKVISAADFDNDPDISLQYLKEDDKSLSSINIEDASPIYHDKSSIGQWKRRKGPAPAIPLLQKRNFGPKIPPSLIRRELQMLEAQQRGLEKQGVRLEEIIRERSESKDVEGEVPTENDPVTDELVLQLFELVNEKNELFRRQAELMYIRRQQRLEEEYADLEHQIRTLMARPEANKTDTDKTKEEQLIQRLVEVVERRNEVIHCLEMDRLREREEDKSIRERLASHRAKRDEKGETPSLTSIENLEANVKKEKKKEKKRWILKDKTKKLEAEKASENEKVSLEGSEQTTIKKEKKHKKWF